MNKEFIKKIAKPTITYILKSIFIGINYGGLAILSNLVLILFNNNYIKSDLFLLFSCIIVDVIFIRLIINASNEARQSYQDKIGDPNNKNTEFKKEDLK